MFKPCALTLVFLAACRATGDPIDEPPPPDLAMPVDQARLDLTQPPDLLPPGDLAAVAMPPPTSCNQRKPGYTALQAFVSVDKYRGLYTGGTGTHEDADVTLLSTIWAYDKNLIETNNVSLAMLVDTGSGNGLPMELPLSVGQVLELEGEYIPASLANAKTDKGPAAVIHFTHSPCGFSVISGKTYH